MIMNNRCSLCHTRIVELDEAGGLIKNSIESEPETNHCAVSQYYPFAELGLRNCLLNTVRL